MSPFWSRHRRRVVLGVSMFFGAAFLTVLLGIRFPKPLLMESGDPPANGSDCVVVLGGEYWTRIPHAIEIYQSNGAPFILLTGRGDAEGNRRQLVEHGIPSAAVFMETNSTSTAENARFSVPLLREHGWTNVILVTSWYHSRRALNCFEHYGPDLHYVSCPTEPDQNRSWPNEYERKRILQEYVKLILYWPRHGVSPW